LFCYAQKRHLVFDAVQLCLYCKHRLFLPCGFGEFKRGAAGKPYFVFRLGIFAVCHADDYLNACKLAYRSWLPGLLLAIAAGVFFIAASPGYLDIYYSEVTLEHVDGASVLKKVYGPWHSLYLFYLLAYFSAMIAAVGYASAKKHLYSLVHAFILLCAVFVNIAVWLLEQLSHINFEFLSVSYIITELFLLGVSLLLQEQREVLCADYSADMPEALSASEVSAEPVAESELYIREEKRREEKRREEKRREEKRREEKRREEFSDFLLPMRCAACL